MHDELLGSGFSEIQQSQRRRDRGRGWGLRALSSPEGPTLRSPSDSPITLLGMVSALFLVGLVVGIVLAVLAVAGVVILVAAGIAWLNAFAVALGRRLKQQQESERLALRQLRRS